MWGIMPHYPPDQGKSQKIKGKSAIHVARAYGERKRSFTEYSFLARGYFVPMVGRDEEIIREYIRSQKKEDR